MISNRGFFSLYPTYVSYLAYCTMQNSRFITAQKVIKVIESFFSLENLNKDVGIRCMMDSEGWVKLSSLMCFIAIKKMKLTQMQLSDCLLNSQNLQTVIEVNDEGEEMKIRRKNWEEIKDKLFDLTTIKVSKICFVQNSYMASKAMMKPKKNMKPMRSLIERKHSEK